jgi:hypothetical protein
MLALSASTPRIPRGLPAPFHLLARPQLLIRRSPLPVGRDSPRSIVFALLDTFRYGPCLADLPSGKEDAS